MKVFFIVLFIVSAGQIATYSGTSRKGECLPPYKGCFYAKPDNRTIQSPGYLFAFDGIKKEMHKSRSGRVYPDSASDSFKVRFYEIAGEPRISSYNGKGQNLSDQPITDLQTTVDISRLPAWASFPSYGKRLALAPDKLRNEKYQLIFNSKLK